MAFLARIRSFWRNTLHRSDMERDMSRRIAVSPRAPRRGPDRAPRPPAGRSHADRAARVRVRGEIQGRGPAESWAEAGRRNGRRPPVRVSLVCQEQSVHVGRRRDTGARHRCQHRDLQLDGCGPDAAAPSRTTRGAGSGASSSGRDRTPRTATRTHSGRRFATSSRMRFPGCSPGALLHSRSSSRSAGWCRTSTVSWSPGITSTRWASPLRPGRVIADADDHRGCPPVAVLSYGFWQTHFGGTDSALGSTLTLNRQPFQVIGVSAPRFHGVEVGKKFDVAVPLCASALFDKRYLDSRGRWWLSIGGRLQPGMTPDQLKSRLEVLSPTVMSAGGQDGNATSQDFSRHDWSQRPRQPGLPDCAARLENR